MSRYDAQQQYQIVSVAMWHSGQSIQFVGGRLVSRGTVALQQIAVNLCTMILNSLNRRERMSDRGKECA